MAYISTGSEWTFELIQRYEHEIARIAANFRLDTYPNQIEIITAEQMLDAYATVGLPITGRTASTSCRPSAATSADRWGWRMRSSSIRTPASRI